MYKIGEIKHIAGMDVKVCECTKSFSCKQFCCLESQCQQFSKADIYGKPYHEKCNSKVNGGVPIYFVKI